MPPWLLRKLPAPGTSKEINAYLKSRAIATVCANARCPNICECYANGNVTFLILGSVCTRACLFCAVKKGRPEKVYSGEPRAVAAAVKKLDLRYIVLTSVTRDDLRDGGAKHYNKVVKAIRRCVPHAIIEVLTPDFGGAVECVRSVAEGGADVFAHNIEMIERLYPKIRPGAEYRRSLKVLSVAAAGKKIPVKSGFMLGLGETTDEVIRMMEDVKGAGCDFLTIGQYLRPKGASLKIEEYIRPEIFESLKATALKMGFKKVASGPFARSSYKAEEMYA